MPQQMRVIRMRPLKEKRKIHPAVWICLAVVVVAAIFGVTWYITSSSGGSVFIKEVFGNMESLSGWEADVRVDSTDFAVDPLSYMLLGSWEGEMVYEAPGSFSLDAVSLDGKYKYSMRVIDDQLYEWNSFDNHWSDLGPVSTEQKSVNPLWDTTLVDRFAVEEGEGLEEVEGTMCKAYSFDQEITIEEETMMGTYEIPYHYQGTFFIDNTRDLLISLDYIAESEGLGRSHYQYLFRSLDQPTTVDIPPGV
ncbi:MAG: hypothetical protein SWK76_12695 [Actinomycetota bacterium]|nr:hypothetical protein [Actinomycetota bacterium]